MVAAARLRRAQVRALSARPYSERLVEMIRRLTTDGAHVGHPLLQTRPVGRAALVVVTGDRGLAGSYNANVLRRAEAVLARLKDGEGRPPAVELYLVGRKGCDYFRRRGFDPVREDVGVADDDLAELAKAVSAELVRKFTDAELDEVIVVFSRFVSVLQQRPEELRLLPVAPPEVGDAQPEKERRERPAPQVSEADLSYIYQPEPKVVYSLLLPRLVSNRLFQALLEARAGEYAARMTAMSAATDNAEDMIERLTLEMHRARQTNITREIMELVGGAEALKQGR